MIFKFNARRRRRVLPASSALFGLVLVSATLIPAFIPAVAAAPQTIVDTNGADDEPGQKDLNSLTVDYAGLPSTISLSWNWDDTATSGTGQSRDGCSLFDTDGDGFANYSLCMSVSSSNVKTQALYSCTADSRTDRCGS